MGRGLSTITQRTRSRHMLVGKEKGRRGEALTVQVATGAGGDAADRQDRWSQHVTQAVAPQSEGEAFTVVVRKTADQTVSASHW